MPIVQIKCPNCGGDIELEDTREFGFCVYCGTKIMITEKVTQKIQIDESHRIDTWLAFCESELKSGDYSAVEKYAEKILENDTINYMGWYYKGISQIRRGKFKGAYVSWVKSVQNCHDKKALRDIFDSIPDMVYDMIYNVNSRYSTTQNNEQTNFDFANPIGISDVDRAFDNNPDFKDDENDESTNDLIFTLFDKFKEFFDEKTILRMKYGMYKALGGIVEEIVHVYLDPYIVLETIEDAWDMGCRALKKTSRPSDDFDIPGGIRWDSIDSDTVFYSIVAKKMSTYLDECSDDDVDTAIGYWKGKDPVYLNYFDEALEKSFDIRDDKALARMFAKSKTKKLVDEYIDAFFSPIHQSEDI